MKFLKTGLLAALALASFAANAGTYNFSYSFDPNSTGDGNPLVVTGSLSGDLVGSFLQNVSDVQVALNGVAFNGAPLFAEGFNATTGLADNTVAPVISTDASQNNFIFADVDVATNPTGASNYFFISGGQTFAINFNTSDVSGNPISGYENTVNSSWNLVAAPVPEPESYAMILAGLGLVGAIARRRAA